MKRPQSPNWILVNRNISGIQRNNAPPPQWYSGPQPGIYTQLSVYDILIAVCPQRINTFTNTIPFLCIFIEPLFKYCFPNSSARCDARDIRHFTSEALNLIRVCWKFILKMMKYGIRILSDNCHKSLHVTELLHMYAAGWVSGLC